MLRNLTRRIWYLPQDDHADRPALGYIRGDRYALMVDAGNSAAHVGLYLDALGRESLPPPDYAALTHWHWDHTFGMDALPCPAIANAQTDAYLDGMTRWAWTDEAMAQRLASGEDNEFCDQTIRVEYPDRSAIRVRRADIVYHNALTLDLGGLTCELLRTENPHTADGTLILVPDQGVLLLGDADCQGNHHGRAPLYRELLEALLRTVKGLRFEVCVRGHEAPVSRQALLDEWRAELA